MKFTFSEPKKDAARIVFVEGDTIRTVEKVDGETELQIGAGKLAEAGPREMLKLVRKGVRVAREQKLASVCLDISRHPIPGSEGIEDAELGRLIAENLIMADYEFTKYKSKKSDEYVGVEHCTLCGTTEALQKGVAVGSLIGEALNECRDLANTPAGDMTPRVLAEGAARLVKGTDATVTVLGKKEIEKLNMGLVLGVSQGSSEEPKFIIAEYWGAGKSEKPIVLAGKGVTFDSGGINLKSSEGIVGMQHDMAGGASVLTALAIAARLKLKKNVVALVPAVENMPSGTAIRPGDVLTSMSGKTVEVLNTDAEGRLILGDALTYAERYRPRLVLDVATLTGAALIALGGRASAVLTRDQKIEDTLRELGEASGEYVWPLPLWKEYDADLKAAVGDIANISTAPNSRHGGTIVGGAFLAQFATAYPWAHIDMAPRMESLPEDNLAKGATGSPVRLLVRMIERW